MGEGASDLDDSVIGHNKPVDSENFLNNNDSSNEYQGDDYNYLNTRNGITKQEKNVTEEEEGGSATANHDEVDQDDDDDDEDDDDDDEHTREMREDQHHIHHHHNSQPDEPEQLRKLFIGGLDYKTSEETLKQHFEKFGDVVKCSVMREPQSKRSRGFGFVMYSHSWMVDKAQDARPHEVDGREVQSKRAHSREDSGKPEAQATVKKVYLGGLSDDIEESELRDYFKEFGTVVNVNIVVHKDTGKRRGFAFVEYDDYDPVDKIVLKKFHTIKDKRIEAKKAVPKTEMDARKRGDPRTAMAGAMMALSGLPLDGRSGRHRPGRSGAAGLWDGPYGVANYPPYSGQPGYGYPPHYHSPSPHFGADWMLHGPGGSPYNFRVPHEGGAYSRNSYTNQGWPSDYSSFPGSHGNGGGGGGPMRLSYHNRGLGPYGTGYGAHRGRGYNP